MNPPSKGRARYELREVLGRGGMGVIYKAYDTQMRREVALKTILDVQSKSALDLFYREWGLQASITHPNVAEIYDIGQMELEGGMKPYFVMPLLPGATLTDLLRKAPHRLTPEKVVDMVSQICRGLQAAHDKGLIHRDLKPSNIFVLMDDSVKIIDFGIAHADTSAQTSVRGTLAYMAPELLQMKPASVAADIFALGVLTYEALTRRRPFEGANDLELSRAILYHNPPPASEINTSVSQSVARVVQKAMAKQPWNRYTSAQEFGETLQKALRGEPIEFFDQAKVRPRIDRAQRAFERGEYPVAAEILNELESEGHIDQEISMLRRQVEQAQRQVTVKQYLESARRFYEEEEYQLSLRKIQEAMELDPNNTDTQALKNEVEKKRQEKKFEEWAQLAKKHLDNNAFVHARSAINSLLELKPNDAGGLALMAELKRREEEFDRLRGEKSKLYAGARDAWERGEVTAALSNLEKYAALDRTSPEADGERLMAFQNLYKQVRGEHEALKNSYDKARKLLGEGNYVEALQICQQYLSKYPGHALFQALKFDVEERKRQNMSAFIAETDRRVESEADLDRRVAILEEALEMSPGEAHFERALKLARDKRDLIAGVVSKARLHEDQGRLIEALDQWEVLRAIHVTYPGLDYEIERVKKRRDAQAVTDAKAEWVEQVDRQLEARDYHQARDSVRRGLIEFPSDPELSELLRLVDQGEAQQKEAIEVVEKARDLLKRGGREDWLSLIEKAYGVDEGNPLVRSMVVGLLAEEASRLLEGDPEVADSLIRRALELDPDNKRALNLQVIRSDQKRKNFVERCTLEARKLQAAGDLPAAIAVVQRGMESCPQDAGLKQLLGTLDRTTRSRGQHAAVQAHEPAVRRYDQAQGAQLTGINPDTRGDARDAGASLSSTDPLPPRSEAVGSYENKENKSKAGGVLKRLFDRFVPPQARSARSEGAPSPLHLGSAIRSETGEHPLAGAAASELELPGSSLERQASGGVPDLVGPGEFTAVFAVRGKGKQSTVNPPAGIQKVTLVIDNCEDQTSRGRRIVVDHFPFKLGRETVDCRLPFDRAIGGLHAELDFQQGLFYVRDCDSENGTYLNGKRLKAGQWEPIPLGSAVGLGPMTQLSFIPNELDEVLDLSGQVIAGRFVLTKRLQTSAKSVVYAALDKNLSRTVAIKILSPLLAAQPGYRDQFIREAKTAAELEHPTIGICCPLESGQTELNLGTLRHTLYVCTKYLEGGSLSERLERGEEFCSEWIVTCFVRIAGAIDYANSRSIVHGAIKPSSIVFDCNGNPFLTDFGNAWRAADQQNSTVIGAPAYLAPEQWDPAQPVSARTDQYALAALLYRMLSGKTPFVGQEYSEVRSVNFNRGAPPVHEEAIRNDKPRVPSALSPILQRALAYRSEDRFENAGAFMAEVARVLLGPKKRRSRNPMVFISYRHRPSSLVARTVMEYLKKRRYRVFLDAATEEGGAQITDKLKHAISECDAFVCLLANSTLDSAWVNQEIRLAAEYTRPMVPVFQEECRYHRGRRRLPEHQQALVGLEGVEVHESDIAMLDRDLQKLCKLLRGIVNRSREIS